MGDGSAAVSPGATHRPAGHRSVAITAQVAAYALTATAVVLTLCLIAPRLRPFANFLPELTLIARPLIAGEVLSSRAMCVTAAEQGLTNVTRNIFLWSVNKSGYEYQFDIHAIASRGGDRFGWNFSDVDWYILPPKTLSPAVWDNVQSGRPACNL